MKDHAMQFEGVVKKYFGNPLSTIYYSNYYGDNFQIRAILFAICVCEINNKIQDDNDLKILNKFHDLFASGNSSFHNCIECITFLDSKN